MTEQTSVVAWISLAIALLGLVIAAVSVGWQMLTWRLEAGRARVSLLHGVATPSQVVHGKVEDGRLRDLSSIHAQFPGGTEVLGVSVINVGRSSIHIPRFSLEVRPEGLSLTSASRDHVGTTFPVEVVPGRRVELWFELDAARALVNAARNAGDIAREVRGKIELENEEVVTTRETVRL